MRNSEKLSSVQLLVCLQYVSSPAVIAAEVVRMVRIVLENQWNIFNDGLAFLADVLPQTMSFFTVMTRTAQMSVGQNYICWIWISNHIHVYIQCPTVLSETHLPAFFTKPTSARTAWQRSQQKQSGCQLRFMAFITRPMTNSPANRTNHTPMLKYGGSLFELCVFTHHTGDSREQTASGSHARSIFCLQTAKARAGNMRKTSQKNTWLFLLFSADSWLRVRQVQNSRLMET